MDADHSVNLNVKSSLLPKLTHRVQAAFGYMWPNVAKVHLSALGVYASSVSCTCCCRWSCCRQMLYLAKNRSHIRMVQVVESVPVTLEAKATETRELMYSVIIISSIIDSHFNPHFG